MERVFVYLQERERERERIDLKFLSRGKKFSLETVQRGYVSLYRVEYGFHRVIFSQSHVVIYNSSGDTPPRRGGIHSM